jgi:sRNA-binding protein
LTPAQAARRQQREQREANAARAERLNRLAHDLVARYPQTFTDPPVPLAIGVDKPLIAALAGIWSAKAVRHFLRFWAGRPAYVAAIAAGEPRCDLDGTPTTAPTEREREHATAAMAGAWGRYL